MAAPKKMVDMVEIVSPWDHGRPRFVVFDFDGTLSLIRGGWTDLMVGMMLESLGPLRRPDESEAALRTLIRNFVLELNGAPTIFQMERFAREIHDRGGQPAAPEHYHREYLQRLGQQVDQRKSRLIRGEISPDDLLVPAARAFMERLQRDGVEMTLASGTELDYVLEEARLLEIDHFFGGRIFAPGREPRGFAKEEVMRNLLTRHGCDASELAAVGDGIVELEAATRLGGLAIGIACDELRRSGLMDVSKCPQLRAAGARYLLADYQHVHRVWDHL